MLQGPRDGELRWVRRGEVGRQGAGQQSVLPELVDALELLVLQVLEPHELGPGY